MESLYKSAVLAELDHQSLLELCSGREIDGVFCSGGHIQGNDRILVVLVEDLFLIRNLYLDLAVAQVLLLIAGDSE